MSWNVGDLDVRPLKALVDLSGAQYRVVELATTEPNAIADYAATGGGYGVLLNNPRQNEFGSVVTAGQIQCMIGSGGCAIGDFICAGTSGFATKITSGFSLPLNQLGRALTTAASGYLFTLDLDVFRVWANSGGKLNT